MKKPQSKAARIYQALTILKRGRLSKTHLADPKDGLSIEDKKAQELPVQVALIPVAELDPATCEGIDDGAETGGLPGRVAQSQGAETDGARGGQWTEQAGSPTASGGDNGPTDEDEFARPGDADGNVA